MKIYPIISYSNDSNCYIIIDEKICIIDTGFTKYIRKKIFEILDKTQKDKEIFIINTHCHYDHIGNDSKIFKKFPNTSVFISEYDKSTIINKDENKVLNYLFGKKFPEIDIEMVKFVKNGMIINLGKTNLEILHTPGHTYGSISIYEKESKSIFTGDLVFADSIGRNDFVDSNAELQKNSIEKILKTNFEILYPGHGRIGNFRDVKNMLNLYFNH